MIAVFYDATCDVIWMSYRRDPFPARTLQAAVSGNTIVVTQRETADAILTIGYDQIVDGSTPPRAFTSAQSCADYLNAEFAKYRALGAQFAQATPVMVWTIVHTLAFLPKVMVIDTAGDPVLTDTRYPAPNVVELQFSAPTSGTAYLS